MKNIDTTRKYYTTRGCKLEDDDYYSTVKNQTFQQNSFYTYSSPRNIITSVDHSSSGSLNFSGTFNLATKNGILTMCALGGSSFLDGTFVWSLNGSAQTNKTSNPAEVYDSDISAGTFVSGDNYISGSFVPTSGTAETVTMYWANGWEE